jgi:cell division protein FtsW (lipid II flippase)
MKKSRNESRFTELQLLIVPGIVAALGVWMVILAPGPNVPRLMSDFWMVLLFVAVMIATHLALVWRLPKADQLLLPIISAMTAFGLVMAYRLETVRTGNIAQKQMIWIIGGYLLFIGIIFALRNVMLLKQYKYTFLFVGLGLTLAAALFAPEINGARLWFNFGFFSLQPGELLKICLVIFLAGYLDDKRDLLQAPYRIGNIPFPPLQYLIPLVAMWGICMALLVFQKDLGPAQLFFGVFLIMLYVASGRSWYVLAGLGVFIGAVIVAYNLAGSIGQLSHVRTRIDVWLNPWPSGLDRGFQIIQALFAFGRGGIFGEGIGYGSPNYIPEVHTDYVYAAIGEEVGLAGAIAVVLLNILLVYRILHIAVRSQLGFYQYLAIGFAALLGLQSFIIMGGVVKLIPLTGMTLPFISYGGSSILINFLIAGLLTRISADSNEE